MINVSYQGSMRLPEVIKLVIVGSRVAVDYQQFKVEVVSRSRFGPHTSSSFSRIYATDAKRMTTLTIGAIYGNNFSYHGTIVFPPDWYDNFTRKVDANGRLTYDTYEKRQLRMLRFSVRPLGT